MLNSYLLEKRLKEYERLARQKSLDQTWHDWKKKKSAKWLDNYKRRIEKFVVDVGVFLFWKTSKFSHPGR